MLALGRLGLGLFDISLVHFCYKLCDSVLVCHIWCDRGQNFMETDLSCGYFIRLSIRAFILRMTDGVDASSHRFSKYIKWRISRGWHSDSAA